MLRHRASPGLRDTSLDGGHRPQAQKWEKGGSSRDLAKQHPILAGGQTTQTEGQTALWGRSP